MSAPISNAELQRRVDACCAGRISSRAIANGELTIEIAASDVAAVCTALRDTEGLAFKQLVDLCVVDYLAYGRADWETSETTTGSGFSRGVESNIFSDLEDGPASSADADGRADESADRRFAVVYHLLSHTENVRLRVRAFATGTPPRIASVEAIWKAANWYEREAFDLFGVLFVGHPDLRRLLTDYGFVGNPFRKDFPLIGEVEVRYDPDKGRVVYEPVSITPRILVPRVIRHDSRYNRTDEP